jgi:hypothetical protein
VDRMRDILLMIEWYSEARKGAKFRQKHATE